MEAGMYRKKPVTIWACRLEDTVECLGALSENGLDPVRMDYTTPPPVLHIETLEGVMTQCVHHSVHEGWRPAH